MRPVPDLDHLVTAVRRRASSDDPMERLAEAVQVGNELGARADALVDHFVSEARDAGLSWAQVGACLGVTKQAAQQQFVEPFVDVRRPRDRHPRPGREGFEAYTRRARQTMKAAVRAAQSMGCTFVGTEHLLLGMIDVGEGVGPDALAAIRPLEEWRAAVVESVTVAPRRVRGRIPFTPLARSAMAHAAVEASRLGHNYVGTEHQLLALAAIGDGVAAKVLTEHGADHDRLRREIVTLLAAPAALPAVGSGDPAPTQPADTASAADAPQ